MSGGILQLAAYGTQDLYMVGDPNITFFKTVYRRHTNFSRTEYDINFTNPLDFGKKGHIRLQQWGDLLHRLFLKIHLPDVQTIVRSFTIGEVQKLLESVNIFWNNGTRSPSEEFTEEDAKVVKALLFEETARLELENQVFNDMLIELQDGGEFFSLIWKENNPNISDESNGTQSSSAAIKYLNDIILDFFKFDPERHLLFRLLDAQTKDKLLNPLPLTNSVKLHQNIMFEEFVRYAISDDGNPNTNNDANLKFYLNTDIANYIIGGGLNQIDTSTVFRGGISNIYAGMVPINLDAYKIFDQQLTQNTTPVLSTADIQNTRNNILDKIRSGLPNNVQLQLQIYDTLTPDTKFIYYRKLPVRSDGSFSSSSFFTNYSLIPNPPAALNDNFTDKLDLTETAVDHYFSTQSKEAVNAYHINNRDLYRTNKFINYYNDLSIWLRIETSNKSANSAGRFYTNTTTGERNYFMNLIWFLMADEIPKAINVYLTQNANLLQDPDRSNLITELTTLATTLIGAISPYINQTNNPETITALEANVKSVTGPTGDIVFSSIIRPNGHLTFNGDQLLIPDYIVENYLQIINTFNAGTQQARYDTVVKPLLQSVTNLYRTALNDLPEYATYLTQNRNIKSGPLERINNIGTSTFIFSDAISSIFYNLVKTNIQNYDNLFNNFLLSPTYYDQNLGNELQRYLTFIANTYFDYTFDINNVTTYDYYLNSPIYTPFLPSTSTQPNNINTYLNFQKTILDNQFAKYDRNRKLLNMRDIVVPRSNYYFERFDLIVDFISGIIENNFDTYCHDFHPDPNNDIVLLTQEKLKNNPNPFTIPKNNAMDIEFLFRNEFAQYARTAGRIATQNPFNAILEPNKRKLWEDTKNTFEKQAEINRFNRVYANFFPDLTENGGAPYLFRFLTLIDSDYKGFTSELNVYDFMRDFTIKDSPFLNFFPDQLGLTVDITNQNIIDELNKRITANTQLIGLIEVINTAIDRSLNAGSPARFAWIRRLGHYLIDYIIIKIGDQTIDKHYGEWLEIWHELSKRIKKEKGYQKLIGDVPQLTTFDSKLKEGYELLIPLQFWFNRHISMALPMLNLLHTDVTIDIKLRTLNEVSYRDPFSKFKRTPKIKCSLLAEYIFIDNEEREKVAKSKLEYLIDTLQYNGEISVNSNDINDDGDIVAKTYFKNPAKEIIFPMQNVSKINGSLPNGERRYHEYGFDPENRINPGFQAKIQFNDRDREEYRDIIFFEQATPMERHHAAPSTGINVYSFALAPENDQPSGAANLTRIDDETIIIKLKPEVIEEMRASNAVCRWPIYALSHNVLRIFSGMAGLVFWGS